MTTGEPTNRREQLVRAAIEILGRDGIAGLSMRSVAAHAGVSLGLVNYHFTDKHGLIRAVLLQTESDDLGLLDAGGSTPRVALRRALRRVVEQRFLTTEYVALRLHLWALAHVDEEFATINSLAQERYRRRLADMVEAARPDLTGAECRRRAADIDILQNGIWLTALLRIDAASLRRAVTRCEEIALGT